MVSISPAGGFALVFLVFIGTCICCICVGRYTQKQKDKNRAAYLRFLGPNKYMERFKEEPSKAVQAAYATLGPNDFYDEKIESGDGAGSNAGFFDRCCASVPTIIVV
jgi:hypothetical protein